MAFSHQAMK